LCPVVTSINPVVGGITSFCKNRTWNNPLTLHFADKTGEVRYILIKNYLGVVDSQHLQRETPFETSFLARIGFNIKNQLKRANVNVRNLANAGLFAIWDIVGSFNNAMIERRIQ
jgi:hypothetical protein